MRIWPHCSTAVHLTLHQPPASQQTRCHTQQHFRRSFRDHICNCTVQDGTRCLATYLPRTVCPCSSHSVQVWPVQALTPGGSQTDRHHVYTWHSLCHNANDVGRAKHEEVQYMAICGERERERETGVPRHERGCRLRRSEVPYCAAFLSSTSHSGT